MNIFANTADAFVMEKVSSTFLAMTGGPLPQSKNGNMSPSDQSAWFHANLPLHLMIFWHAFPEAKRRGLLNAFEQAAAQEVFDIIANS